MREQHRNIITQKLGRAAGNGYKVLDQLYLNPIISVVVRELSASR
jgi:hypothetical protein